MAKTKTKLSDRQEMFCHEYVVDRNATQAYIRAGYSPNGADKLASRLMGKDGIRARIDELMEEAKERVRLSADDVIKVWSDVIHGDDSRTCDKLMAARDAGKHLGMFVEKHDVNMHGDIRFNVIIKKS